MLGTVTVNSLSTIAPGESVGTLTTGAKTWAGGGRYDWEITDATAAGSWDLLAVNGSINITATAGTPFVLKLVSPAGPLPGFNSESNYTWIVATTTGGVTGFAANKFTVDAAGLGINPNGGTFTVVQQGNNLAVRFTPYTAPATPPGIAGIAPQPDGSMNLMVTGAVGQVVVLQANTNVTTTSWLRIGTNTLTGAGSAVFPDPQATNLPSRFYRALSE